MLRPPTIAELKAETQRRQELEAQRLSYMARERGPALSAQSQFEVTEGPAKGAPKPLAAELERLTARARRRRAVRQAGRLSSGGIAGNSLQNTDQRANEAQSQPGLKLWPEIGQAALRMRKDRAFRIWTIARSLPDAGSGRVRVQDIEDSITREELHGLSGGTLRRLLRQGSGTFWAIAQDASGDKVLYLAGLGSVALALKVERLAHSPVLIPYRWAKSLLAFRAAIYASGFPTSDWSNPISRAVLEELTGKTGRTQRNYDAALSGKLSKRENAKMVSGKPKHGDELPDGYFVDKVRTKDGDEHLIICQRLPNSFTVEFERGRRGMARKVNRQLRGNSPRHVGGGTQQRKLFYRDAAAMHRRIQQAGDDWFCMAGAEVGGRRVSETIGRTQLWTPVQKVGGRVIFA